MSELSDAFKALKAQRRSPLLNVRTSTEILNTYKVDFEYKNEGLHLVVSSAKGLIDFWPSTGLWIPRHVNKRGRGVFPLLTFIGVEYDHSRSQGKPRDT